MYFHLFHYTGCFRQHKEKPPLPSAGSWYTLYIMILSLIAAMAENRVIGRAGAMPWHIPEDLARFKKITWGHTLIMGRVTFEGLGKPLSGRRTIVVSHSRTFTDEHCTTARSIGEALTEAERRTPGNEEVFITGGGTLYRETISRADRIYLTLIHREYDGDTFFPEFDENLFTESERGRCSGEDPCTFYMYLRK